MIKIPPHYFDEFNYQKLYDNVKKIIKLNLDQILDENSNNYKKIMKLFKDQLIIINFIKLINNLIKIKLNTLETILYNIKDNYKNHIFYEKCKIKKLKIIIFELVHEQQVIFSDISDLLDTFSYTEQTAITLKYKEFIHKEYILEENKVLKNMHEEISNEQYYIGELNIKMIKQFIKNIGKPSYGSYDVNPEKLNISAVSGLIDHTYIISHFYPIKKYILNIDTNDVVETELYNLKIEKNAIRFIDIAEQTYNKKIIKNYKFIQRRGIDYIIINID